MTKPPWTHRVEAGRASVLVYVDPDRRNKLTLKWRSNGKPKKVTLDRSAEVVRGKLAPEDEQFAIAAAMKKSLELSGQVPATVHRDPGKPLTIAEAEALIIDPETGKYPHRTPFRDELVRSLRFACVVWGLDTPWLALEEEDFTKLFRRRLEILLNKGKRGVRATEITLSGLITTVRWLRKKKHIPRDAAPWPDDWKAEIVKHWQGVVKTAREPQPHRPRFTLEEARAILKHADFDPRFHLLMWLGMELRLGQVVRMQRSDLELPPVDWQAEIPRDDKGSDTTDYGAQTIYGSGKKGVKGGVVTDLTRGQRAMVDHAMSEIGYLGVLEQRYQNKELADYSVFPAGYIVGRVGNNRGQSNRLTLSDKIDPQVHAASSWVRKSFREAERRANVPHIEGRGGYGVRRTGRDFADDQGLGRSATENWGTWTPGSTIMDEVYRSRANKAGRREARPARAAFRGEGDA